MSSKSTDITNKLMTSVSNLKESTFITILMVIMFILVFMALLYYFYMRNLVSKECSYMDGLYSALDAKIHSLNPSDADCSGNLRDYYIKTAYNCCSAGSYKNDFVS